MTSCGRGGGFFVGCLFCTDGSRFIFCGTFFDGGSFAETFRGREDANFFDSATMSTFFFSSHVSRKWCSVFVTDVSETTDS
jgi:hypothetical protein